MAYGFENLNLRHHQKSNDSGFTGCLDPAKLLNKNYKYQKKAKHSKKADLSLPQKPSKSKTRKKLKRQRVDSNSSIYEASQAEQAFYRRFKSLKKVCEGLHVTQLSNINRVIGNEDKIKQVINSAIKKSMPEKGGNCIDAIDSVVSFAVNFLTNFIDQISNFKHDFQSLHDTLSTTSLIKEHNDPLLYKPEVQYHFSAEQKFMQTRTNL